MENNTDDFAKGEEEWDEGDPGQENTAVQVEEDSSEQQEDGEQTEEQQSTIDSFKVGDSVNCCYGKGVIKQIREDGKIQSKMNCVAIIFIL